MILEKFGVNLIFLKQISIFLLFTLGTNFEMKVEFE